MLTFFRSFMRSKLGVLLALGFLVLIALAFAAGDVAGMRQSVGLGSGDRVATVGKTAVTATDLVQAANNSLEQARRENPGLTMAQFLAAGGLSDALDRTIDRTALAEFGRANGVIASDRLVDSEIAKLPAFQGPDGKFSEAAYRALLQQRGLTDALVRRDLGEGLVARQLLTPAAFAARMPDQLVSRYAALLAERREGAIALLPSAALAASGAPTDAELASFYAANRARYRLPERRTIRYAVFDESAVKAVAPPTDAEVAARYNAGKAIFGPSESRAISQLVLPTEAAARAVAAEVAGGKSLEASASAKGLAVAKVGPATREVLAAQTSEAVASAAFAAAKGKLAGPLRGPLGWVVVRVDAIDARAGKTLDQARPEIVAALTAEKRRAALTDFSARIEDELDNGASLGDLAKERGLTIAETAPLLANGQVFGGTAGQTAPAVLGRALATAFAMEREGQPQLAEVEAGKTFLIFDVSRIVPAAPAPLGEIKPRVAMDLRLRQGAAKAKAAAEQVLAKVKQGADLSAAMAALGVAQLPPVDRVDLAREDLARPGQTVPPPLALLFSMAQGTTKVLAAPNDGGWYVVSLSRIVPGDAAKVAPVLPSAKRELSELAGREYATQLRLAIRQAVGVTRNQAAIDAVARRLSGGN